MADRFTVVAAIRGPKAEGSAWGATPSAPVAVGAGKWVKSGKAQTEAHTRSAGGVEPLARAWRTPLKEGGGRCGGAGIRKRIPRRPDGENTRTDVQEVERVWCARTA
jgi:hypothetical protein